MWTTLRATALALVLTLVTVGFAIAATAAVGTGVPDLHELAVIDVQAPLGAPIPEPLPTAADVVAAAGDALITCLRFDQAFPTLGGSAYRLHLLVPRASAAKVTERLATLTAVRVMAVLPFRDLRSAHARPCTTTTPSPN